MSRRSGSLAALVCGLVVLLPVLNCTTGGVSGVELQQPEIAFVYWDRQAAREREEALEGAPFQASKLGVARMDDLGRMLGGGRGGSEELGRRFPGYLSLVNPVTGAIRRIEHAPPGAVPLDWSPDRSSLLVAAASRRHGLQLFEYRVAVEEFRPLTTGPAMHTRGHYGPDGQVVISRQGTADGPAIELTGPQGDERRTILSGVGIDDVRWSPRGDMLAIAVVDPTRPERGGGLARMLFALPANATEQTWPPGSGSELISLGRGRDPVFSVDGEWIVYSARVGDGWRLRRVRAEGGGKLTLGRGVRDEFEPTVSPDGKLVAFVSEEGGLDRLFVRRFDGTGDRLLIPDGAVARPVW